MMQRSSQTCPYAYLSYKHLHPLKTAPPNSFIDIQAEPCIQRFLFLDKSAVANGVSLSSGELNIHLQVHCPEGQAQEVPQLQEHPGSTTGLSQQKLPCKRIRMTHP